ncbi:hypothetical protein ACLQ9J_04880 [Bordetella hinzii]|uniref:hypothetical protein n=1 Tax=Bordetella hinzii TaxID=103855 RepID=UPI0039FBB4A7
MTFQQHIDALQSALAQTRTDFGGPATCSVAAEDLRVALHLIGQAALVPSPANAEPVRVVAWRARDGHGLPQTTWIDGDPGPQMESAWVGGDIERAYAGPVAAQAPTNNEIDKAILQATIRDLAAISEHLGIDPNEGGAVPIIEAINDLRRERDQWADAGYAAQAAAAGDALDAARYRCLREKRDGDGPAAGVRCLNGPYLNAAIYGEQLDAATDAAIAAQQCKGGKQ